MNPRFKINLLEHAKVISAWARTHDAKAFIDLADLALAVQRGRRAVQFTAQFVGRRDDGHLGYLSWLGPACIGMVGWLPYPIQQWPISTSKLAFKRTIAELGYRSPATWVEAASVDEPFIVKGDRSAFGDGIRGPFRADDAGTTWPALQPGEFAEAFKPGRIARAWYWAGALHVLEIFEMPRLTGNGRDDFEATVRSLLGAGQPLPEGIVDLGRLQDAGPGRPVPKGLSLIADFRYVSPLNPTVYTNHNDLVRWRGTRVADTFATAGAALWPLLPGAAQRPMVFVLDAIVDDRDEVWFLEINCNAQLHPDIYAPMLDTLLGCE